MDLNDGGWIYTGGGKSVGMAACIPHGLFTCSTGDVSEIIFLRIFTLFKKGLKKCSVCESVGSGG